MLALDNTLRHIETSEADVLDLFQSSPLPVNLAGSPAEPRAAYICAVRKKEKVQVYVALAAEHGRNFFYTQSGSLESEQSYRDSLERALAFARSMGFKPERVNLEYSPAMRAVVVRNFRIFNFPGNARRVTASGPALAYEKLPVDDPAASVPRGAAAAAIGLATSAASVATAATATVAAGVKSAASKGSDKKEQKEAITDLILKFGNEMAELRAERSELAAKAQELSAANLGITAELTAARNENKKLAAERDKLAGSADEMAKASSQLSAAKKKIEQLSGERDKAKVRTDELLAENAALSEAAARAEEEIARAKEEAAGAREAAASAKENAAGAAEKLAKAAEEAAKAKEEAAKAKEEAAKSKEEAAKAREEAAKAVAEAAAAREELKKAQEEAARSKKEAAKLAKERDLLAKRAEELAQGSDSAGRDKEELLAKLHSVSAERDTALSRAEKLAQQLESQRVELEATRGELAGLVSACEQLLGLATGRASVVAALPKPGTSAVALGKAEAEIEAETELALDLEAVAEAETAAEMEDVARLIFPEETAAEVEKTVAAELAIAAEVAVEVEIEVEAAEEAVPQLAAAKEEVESAKEEVVGAETETETMVPVTADLSKTAENAAKVVKTPEPEPRQLQQVTRLDHSGLAQAATPGVEALAATAALPDFTAMRALPAESDFTAFPFAGFGAADAFFGDFSCGETPIFLLKKDQAVIEYSSPEDVIRLHKSYNIANVAPDGGTQERCEGYICCVRSNGEVHTFAAIYGTETGRMGIYVPEVQAFDEQGVAAAVAGAVSFHEQVGLMIDLADLPSPEQRAILLAKCTVLKLVA